jgi:hypothetical protein
VACHYRTKITEQVIKDYLTHNYIAWLKEQCHEMDIFEGLVESRIFAVSSPSNTHQNQFISRTMS